MASGSLCLFDCDAVIIGGGAAGLFCGWNVARSGLSVIILEKNSIPGKKLLLSGSGRCNITNNCSKEEFLTKYGDKGRFVKSALYNFTNSDLIGFLLENGIAVVDNGAGKVFPESGRSRDIVNLLIDLSLKSGVTIMNSSPALSVTKIDGGFETQFTHSAIRSKKLVIATGGKSYPATGSTGDGYLIAGGLGHNIIEPQPALTPVIVKNYRFEKCAGISIKGANLIHYRNGKKVGEHPGDLLFTHHGLSGPAVIDYSRSLRAGDELSLNMAGDFNSGTLDEDLIGELAENGKKTVRNCLSKYGIPDGIIVVLLEEAGIDSCTTAAFLTKNERKKLTGLMTGCRFVIERVGDFNEAMATAGGIDTAEVNGKTMESRIVDGLYIIGEVLDVDGESGGFNLQFAFSSGRLAADDIIRSINENNN